MKTVYLFKENTGEFLREYEAQESPLELGEYITPIHSTDLPPLEPKNGFAVCFRNGAWQYVTDNRGAWFKPDGEVVDIEDIEADTTTLTRDKPPPTPEQLAEMQEAALVQQLQLDTKANAAFDALKAASFSDINTFVNTHFSSVSVQGRAALKVTFAAAGAYLRTIKT